jgi:hypothetical protein
VAFCAGKPQLNLGMKENMCYLFKPLPLLFKALLHGQKDRVFFSGHFNLHTKPDF